MNKKSLKDIHFFLNTHDIEGLKDYKHEAEWLSLYDHTKITWLDIVRFWNIRFNGSRRHSVTAANLIHSFLK